MKIALTPEELNKVAEIFERHVGFSSRDRDDFLLGVFSHFQHGRALLRELLNTSDVKNIITKTCTFGYMDADRKYHALAVLLDSLNDRMGRGEDSDYLEGLYERLFHTGTTSPQSTPPTRINRAVFISFASPDIAVASLVNEYLKGAGLETYFFPSDSITAGTYWQQVIDNALNNATQLVLLMSSSSMPYRKEVYLEWSKFERQNKPIIPLLIEDCEIPAQIAPMQYIDARTNLTSALRILLNTL